MNNVIHYLKALTPLLWQSYSPKLGFPVCTLSGWKLERPLSELKISPRSECSHYEYIFNDAHVEILLLQQNKDSKCGKEGNMR